MASLEFVSKEYLEVKEKVNSIGLELIGTKYDSKGNEYISVRKKIVIEENKEMNFREYIVRRVQDFIKRRKHQISLLRKKNQ